jgi:DNA-binding transcriptional ArsR family regulator
MEGDADSTGIDLNFADTIELAMLVDENVQQVGGPHVARRSVHSHSLTCICLKRYIGGMESTFAIIAEPNRRAILSLLAASEQSVGEIEEKLNLSQPSVSKHLRVLREAGFVEARVDAQRRLYRINPEPLMEIDAWLAPFRRFWSVHLDALERHLDQVDPAPRSKGKKR